MRPAYIVLGGVFALAACAGNGYDVSSGVPGAGPDGSARSTGVLFVQRVKGDSTAGVQVGARFLRVAGVADEALPDLVGTPAMPRAGACVERGGAAGSTVDGSRAEVRLLDVGAIEVRAGDVATRMYPRRFPDLWNVVSGVLYGMEGDMPLPLGQWRFSAPGDQTSGVGSFDVEAQAPDELLGVRVADWDLAAQTGAVALPRHGVLPVRWNRSPNDDQVAIVFEGTGTIVCGARDEGWFDVDAATTERLGDVLRGGGTVSVHRLRSRPFAATGLDAGSLVFDLSVRARARVE